MIAPKDAFTLAQQHPKCAINMIRLKRQQQLCTKSLGELSFFQWNGHQIGADTKKFVIPLRQFISSTEIDLDLWERELLEPILEFERRLKARPKPPKNYRPVIQSAAELLSTCGKNSLGTENLATLLAENTTSTCGKINNSEVLATSKPIGSVAVQYKTCGKNACRCRTGAKHGPYAYLRRYNPNKPSKQDWLYLGKVGGRTFLERCNLLEINAQEIEYFAQDSR